MTGLDIGGYFKNDELGQPETEDLPVYILSVFVRADLK